MTLPLVLASRSPRRRELLAQLVPVEQIEILPPSSPEELGFEGLASEAEIAARLLEVAADKLSDVQAQLTRLNRSVRGVIAADTIVVVQTPSGQRRVLGQPPAQSGWREVVRDWFCEYYAGREHQAWTGLCVANGAGRVVQRIVTTTVRMMPDVEPWLEWYLSTGESLGKAGGYALQGAGSLFIEEVRGSLSNVIGLPVRELAELLQECEIDVGGA